MGGVLWKLLACAVGAKATCPITIENPLGKEISLQAHVTNRTNFVVDPPSVTLPPYGDATVLVEYVPSSIGEDEHTQITLTNPNLGDWQYLATGRGEPPAIMPEHCPVATVAEASSYMFSFRNPFPMPLVLDVTLRNTKVDATSAAAAVPELAMPPFGLGYPVDALFTNASLVRLASEQRFSWHAYSRACSAPR